MPETSPLRFLFLILLCAFSLPGCGDDASVATTNTPGYLEDFAQRYAAAWSGNDPGAFAAFYAADATFRINDGEAAEGRAAIEAVARDFMTAFPDMRVTLVELRDAGEVIEFHWRWTGTNTGPGGTGNRVDLTGYEAWVMSDDGLILSSQGHLDDAEYQRQLNEEQ